MRKAALTAAFVTLLLPTVVSARFEPMKYRLSVIYGLGNDKAGQSPYFTFNHNWGFAAGLNGKTASFTFSLLFQKNQSDSAASGHFGFFAGKNDGPQRLTGLRLGFDGDYRLISHGSLRPTVGAGLGYLVWKISNPLADTTLKVTDSKGGTVDFGAAEMFISGSVGLEIEASSRLILHIKTGVDYLTGIGTSFNAAVDKSRPRLVMRGLLSVSYLFGGGDRRSMMPPSWPSSEAWNEKSDTARALPAERDSDGDGVMDKYDKCFNTPAGAFIDADGCPTDSDGDGVYDGLDDCPRTPDAAAGYVDIYGCPIDSDFDGVSDYQDNCRSGPVGALVDVFGCPTDSDSDGVYDGLDDCPESEAGIEVDERGCIDISFLAEPMVVSIDYPPGSFEVDERTKLRLGPLIKKLQILTLVKIEIYGYTDNVGPAEANQTVSQRRANRMRDWLESQGIARERMTPVGRGETNFIASNDTAEGRAKNRRIELVFGW